MHGTSGADSRGYDCQGVHGTGRLIRRGTCCRHAGISPVRGSGGGGIGAGGGGEGGIACVTALSACPPNWRHVSSLLSQNCYSLITKGLSGRLR